MKKTKNKNQNTKQNIRIKKLRKTMWSTTK